jgi:copper chaperone NosL
MKDVSRIAYFVLRIARNEIQNTHNGIRLTSIVFLSALLLAACSPKAKSDEPQPPDIAYGLELCDACGMIIDNAKFAAATLTLEGDTHKFDDIGDMLVFHMDHPEEQVKVYFVHDYDSEAWMRGETAFYVRSEMMDTPMGHGIAAFETEEAAEKFAAELGEMALTFNELRIAVHEAVHG